MLTREIAIATAKEFVEGCKSKDLLFDKVILFGSTVHGIPNEHSDIDLLLVSDKFGYSKWQNLGLVAPISLMYENLDVHLYPTEYFLKGDIFIDEVKRTGIEIG